MSAGNVLQRESITAPVKSIMNIYFGGNDGAARRSRRSLIGRARRGRAGNNAKRRSKFCASLVSPSCQGASLNATITVLTERPDPTHTHALGSKYACGDWSCFGLHEGRTCKQHTPGAGIQPSNRFLPGPPESDRLCMVSQGFGNRR
jgi:hypothetical protein